MSPVTFLLECPEIVKPIKWLIFINFTIALLAYIHGHSTLYYFKIIIIIIIIIMSI